MSETLYCISFVAYPSMEIEHVVINTFSHSPNIMQSSFVPDIQKKRKADGCWLSGNVWWEEGKGGKDNPAFDPDESQGGDKKEEEPTS